MTGKYGPPKGPGVVTLNVTIPIDLMQWLRQEAEDNKVGMSRVVTVLIREAKERK